MSDPTRGKCHECGFVASIEETFLEGSIEVEIMDDFGDVTYDEEYMLICPICRENQW